MGTSLKGKILLREEAKFFLLRAVPYGMENHFYLIRRLPLNVTIFFISNVRLCVMRATPMCTRSIQNMKSVQSRSSFIFCTYPVVIHLQGY